MTSGLQLACPIVSLKFSLALAAPASSHARLQWSIQESPIHANLTSGKESVWQISCHFAMAIPDGLFRIFNTSATARANLAELDRYSGRKVKGTAGLKTSSVGGGLTKLVSVIRIDMLHLL